MIHDEQSTILPKRKKVDDSEVAMRPSSTDRMSTDCIEAECVQTAHAHGFTLSWRPKIQALCGWVCVIALMLWMTLPPNVWVMRVYPTIAFYGFGLIVTNYCVQNLFTLLRRVFVSNTRGLSQSETGSSMRKRFYYLGRLLVMGIIDFVVFFLLQIALFFDYLFVTTALLGFGLIVMGLNIRKPYDVLSQIYVIIGTMGLSFGFVYFGVEGLSLGIVDLGCECCDLGLEIILFVLIPIVYIGVGLVAFHRKLHYHAVICVIVGLVDTFLLGATVLDFVTNRLLYLSKSWGGI